MKVIFRLLFLLSTQTRALKKRWIAPELHSSTPSFGVWWLAFHLLSVARPLIPSQCCRILSSCIYINTVTLNTVSPLSQPKFWQQQSLSSLSRPSSPAKPAHRSSSSIIYGTWPQVSILRLFTVLSNLFAVLPTVHLSQQVAHLCHHPSSLLTFLSNKHIIKVNSFTETAFRTLDLRIPL